VERIKAHGGDVMQSERAERLVVRSGRVSGLVVDGDEHPTGVQFVVGGGAASALLELAHPYEPSRRAVLAMPQVRASSMRFVVSMVVRDDGLPAPLGHEAFIVPEPPGWTGAIHLQRSVPDDAPKGCSLLVAETLLSLQSQALEEALETARARVLDTLGKFLPFFERHLLVVDSPHDGLPLWDYRDKGSRKLVDRALLRRTGGTVEPEAMRARYTVEPAGLYGLAGEMLRTPLGNTFVVGRSAMPALGQEGELLAAWSVARIITRTDRKKERMRREMWSKVELG